jgi:hypothetical protein
MNVTVTPDCTMPPPRTLRADEEFCLFDFVLTDEQQALARTAMARANICGVHHYATWTEFADAHGLT